MEWLIIPVSLAVIAGICFGIVVLWDKIWFSSPDFIGAIAGVGLIGCAITMLMCPFTYFITRVDTAKYEAYYREVALPNMVEEHTTYIVIKGLEVGLWQAGEMNLSTYNAWLGKRNFLNSLPVLSTAIHNPPEDMKFIRVIG